jgi:pimeloyl-ACP methyl ester carboxylesterase
VPTGLQNEVVVHVFYLHGFASSPQSGKAAYLRERLEAAGLRLHVPDFNRPDFSTLTVSRMLAQVDDAIRLLEPGPVALIGSSLGGFVAIHAAARQAPGGAHPIAKLVLLAPAVDFCSGRDGWLSAEELDEWRRTNRRDVLHHADGRSYPLRYQLYEDGRRYDAFAACVTVPTLVFQGLRDSIVRPASVQDWAAARGNVLLRMLDDDHQLQLRLDVIWRETARFLGLAVGGLPPGPSEDPAAERP